MRRRGRPPQQHRDRDERDRHQHRDAEERPAPADPAEEAPEQRPRCDAQPERRLVEHDRAADPAARRADDDRQRGGDEERVAEAPAGAEAGDLRDRVRRARERAEHDHEREPAEQRALGPDPRRDEAGPEHRHAGDREVRREEHRHLARRRVEVLRQDRQDRVDEPDPHEGDDGRERDRPHRLRLAQQAGAQAIASARRSRIGTASESVSRSSGSSASICAPRVAARRAAPLVEQRLPGGGDRDEDGTAVGRVLAAGHEPLPLEPADEGRGRRLGDRLVGRQLGDPLGAGGGDAVQGGGGAAAEAGPGAAEQDVGEPGDAELHLLG